MSSRGAKDMKQKIRICVLEKILKNFLSWSFMCSFIVSCADFSSNKDMFPARANIQTSVIENLVISYDANQFGLGYGITVNNVTPGSVVSLHKGSCDSSADSLLTENGTLTVKEETTYTEVDLYIKYTMGNKTECRKLDNKYIYLEKPVLSLDQDKTRDQPASPIFKVSNLFIGKKVKVEIFKSPDCSGEPFSRSHQTNTGAFEIKDSYTLIHGSYKYSVKQSYKDVSSCSNVLNYTYNKFPEFDGFMHERGQVYFYDNNQNRGIIIKNTTFMHKIRLYTGTSCEDEGKYIKTITTLSDRTEVETPNLADGMYRFSFKEFDSEDNFIGCYTSPRVKLKTPRYFSNSYGRIELDKTRSIISTYGMVEVNKILSKKVKHIYTSEYAFAILFEDGSVKSVGLGDQGGDSEDVRDKLNDGSKPVVSIVNTPSAFAALRSDGSVITWGSSNYGGNSSSVSGDIDGTIPVVKLWSNRYSFAALRSDGSVVSWGNTTNGGSMSASIKEKVYVVDGPEFSPVVSIFANYYTFAALRTNGSVVAWGNNTYGANTTSVESKINGEDVKVTAIYNTMGAFAVLRSDGSVVSWGYSSYGGDYSEVADKIGGSSVKVVTISSATRAFAAICTDGSVVTWGDANYGGKSTTVASKINGSNPVISISSSSQAFAALRSDGSIVTWGISSYGGNHASIADKVDGSVPVSKVISSDRAFAALRSDGSVVTWGGNAFGGDSSSVTSELSQGVNYLGGYNAGFYTEQEDTSLVIWPKLDTTLLDKPVSNVLMHENAVAILRKDGSVIGTGVYYYGNNQSETRDKLAGNVTKIVKTNRAFAALKDDGSVVTWGETGYGGTITDTSLLSKLDGTNDEVDVVELYSNNYAFAALRRDGSVVTWGNSNFGGSSFSVEDKLDGTVDVVQVVASRGAFAARLVDGSVVSWGADTDGGDYSGVANEIDGTDDEVDVVELYATNQAFAALRSNGSVVSWGHVTYGGDYSGVVSEIDGSTYPVEKVYSNTYAFAALRSNGSVVTWGSSSYGGKSTAVASKIGSDVTAIYSTERAFAALKSDGTVVTWGADGYGGSITGVASALNGTKSVIDVYATNSAFAALKDGNKNGEIVEDEDGSIVTWGSSSGGNSTSVSSELSSAVISVSSNYGAFAVIKSDGSVVSWGNSSYGGDSSSVADKLNGEVKVTKIIPVYKQGFIAEREDGTQVYWGSGRIEF